MNKGEIVSVMTPQEMNILPHEQVFEWGLRSMELLNLPFPANSGKETEQKPCLMPQKMLIRKTEELAKASSSALVYCIAERSVLRILLPQPILNRFDGMNRLDIIGSV